MGSYIAFDVSLHVVDETGKFLWRGKCASEPDALAAVVRKRAPDVVRVGVETGFLSTWLCHALTEAGLPVRMHGCAQGPGGIVGSAQQDRRQ